MGSGLNFLEFCLPRSSTPQLVRSLHSLTALVDYFLPTFMNFQCHAHIPSNQHLAKTLMPANVKPVTENFSCWYFQHVDPGNGMHKHLQ